MFAKAVALSLSHRDVCVWLLLCLCVCACVGLTVGSNVASTAANVDIDPVCKGQDEENVSGKEPRVGTRRAID